MLTKLNRSHERRGSEQENRRSSGDGLTGLTRQVPLVTCHSCHESYRGIVIRAPAANHLLSSRLLFVACERLLRWQAEGTHVRTAVLSSTWPQAGFQWFVGPYV